jgi:predicted DNA-binding protein (MmcQ/YjbR family)
VELDGSIDPDDLRDMIDHSYELVVMKVPRAERNRLLGDTEPGTGKATWTS